MLKCHFTRVLKTFGIVFVSQFQEGQASSVCLFFDPVRSEYPAYHFINRRSYAYRPVKEPLFVPFTV